MPAAKITTTIPQEGIEKLTRNARLFSYMMSSFNKVYLILKEEKAEFYFKGNKSLMTLAVPLTQTVPESVYMTIDINKFLSAARKVIGENGVNLTLTNSPPSLRMSSDTSNDNITLSVQIYQKDNVDVSSLETFFDEKVPLFDKGVSLTATDKFMDFVHVTSTYMSTMNKNNSIAIEDDKLIYADRTVVLSMKESVLSEKVTNCIKVHKFVLGFLDLVSQESPILTFDETQNFVYWISESDPSFKAIMAIDPCVIAIPDETDVKAITPEESKEQILVLKPSKLLRAIDFFSGLFEASAWKPITFVWNEIAGEQKVTLTYQHPTTEVEKDLEVEAFEGNLTNTTQGASFILISDTLRTLLSRMEDSGELRMHFNEEAPDAEHGAGIYVTYTTEDGEILYKAVLAKLAE